DVCSSDLVVNTLLGQVERSRSTRLSDLTSAVVEIGHLVQGSSLWSWSNDYTPPVWRTTLPFLDAAPVGSERLDILSGRSPHRVRPRPATPAHWSFRWPRRRPVRRPSGLLRHPSICHRPTR